MGVNFPDSPTNGQTTTVGNTTYSYNSSVGAWEIVSSGGIGTMTTKGDLLSRSSSGLARVGVGTNGQVLTADSAETSGMKWSTGPGLQLIKTQSFTSSSSENIENVFSSEFRNYKIMMTLYATGSAVRSVRLRWRTGTTNAQGSDYYPKGWYNFGTLTGYSPAAQTSAYIGDCFNNAQYPAYFSLDVFDPNEASRTAIIGQAMESYNIYAYNFNNIHAVGTAYTGFNLTLDADNLTGTVRVYGYRN